MDEDLIALLIPIFGIVFGIGIGIVAIIAGHREKVKRVELRHRERLAAIEKGLELPPDPPEVPQKKGGLLRTGLIGLFVGIVLYIALSAVADEEVAFFGLIPAAFGLANLITYFVELRRNGKSA
jgi:hypothetical protein